LAFGNSATATYIAPNTTGLFNVVTADDVTLTIMKEGTSVVTVTPDFDSRRQRRTFGAAPVYSETEHARVSIPCGSRRSPVLLHQRLEDFDGEPIQVAIVAKCVAT
jgi:hypothetical protein